MGLDKFYASMRSLEPSPAVPDELQQQLDVACRALLFVQRL